MTWRARAETDYGGWGVAVHLGNRTAAGILVPRSVSLEYESIPEGVTTSPFLHLEEGAAMALRDALNEHFGGTPVTVTQREDYLHERKRVDDLLHHITNSHRALVSSVLPTETVDLGGTHG